MSLHIKLQKDKKSLNSKIELVISFLNYFKHEIELLYYQIKLNGEVGLQNKFDWNISSSDVNPNSEEVERISVDFFFKINGIMAYVEVNNEYQSRFVEDIEFNLIDLSLADFLSNDLIRNKLDKFLMNQYKEKKLVKAYVDLNEEGEDNPLDVIYEYEPRGSNFFIKVIKALELLAEDSPQLLNLYNKVKSSDKNYVASRLWNNDRIRGMIFNIASSQGIVAQEGSVLLFAKDKEEIKDYYLKIINDIISPIFDNVPSLEKEIENFSDRLPN